MKNLKVGFEVFHHLIGYDISQGFEEKTIFQNFRKFEFSEKPWAAVVQNIRFYRPIREMALSEPRITFSRS